MIQRRRRQRGSVLLLAVGLVTILAMLGATLLLSSYLDARQSKALAAKAQADPIATGILAQVKARLKADLYLGNRPYDGLSADANGWRRFIDYPSRDVDRHLASHYSEDLADPALGTYQDLWPHVTNLTGTSGQGVIEWVPFDSDDHANSDGDGNPPTNDALRYDTGVTNADGQRYYAAVRVTDMSGKICLNTAAESNNLTMPTSPVNIDMRDLLDLPPSGVPGTYNAVNGERSGGAAPQDFFDNSASALFAPALPAYRPFAIGEEMYFRWLGQGQLTTAGRLAPIFSDPDPDVPVSTARQLTTFNCSRTSVRNPGGALTEQYWLEFADPPDPRKPVSFFDVADTEREDVYQKVKGMLAALGIGASDNDRREIAAHFVANMWAYQDYSPANADKAYRFEPTGSPERFAVFGLIPDLVITEAFAAHKANTLTLPQDNHAWGYAIEITNFTDRKIKDLATEYELWMVPANVELTLPPLVALAPYQAVVLYSFGEGDDGGGETDIFGPNFDNTWWDWVECAGLDFSLHPTEVILLRKAKDGSDDVEVPADQVANDILGLDYQGTPDKGDPFGIQYSNIRRDNSPGRARFNVAAYKRFSGTTLPGEHRLGQRNKQVNADDLADNAKFSVPIICSGRKIADLGELGLIYLAGPIDENTNSDHRMDLKGFPRRLTQLGSILPDTPARGRFDFHPDNINYMGYSSGTYPDVPVAAMLGEFFTLVPPDDTRTDEPDNEWTRIYGRVNINTATREVLERLPWPNRLPDGTEIGSDDVKNIVDYILAYRDQRNTADNFHRYANERAPKAGAGIIGLRGSINSDINGFFTPGEIAIPLADYSNVLLGWTDYSSTASQELDITQNKDYIYKRDSLYRAISNLITVNSDTYAVNIRVDLYDVDESPPAGEPAQSWYYVAVIDRSNCREPADTPAVLLFSEVK